MFLVLFLLQGLTLLVIGLGLFRELAVLPAKKAGLFVFFGVVLDWHGMIT